MSMEKNEKKESGAQKKKSGTTEKSRDKADISESVNDGRPAESKAVKSQLPDAEDGMQAKLSVSGKKDKNKYEFINYSTDPGVIKLLRKKKKGLLRIVFSRFGITALLVLVQALLVIAMLVFFNEEMQWAAVLEFLFTLVIVFHLFRTDMDASAKLTWMFLIALMPLPAAVLLLFAENDMGHKRIGRKQKKLIKASKNKLVQDVSVLKEKEPVEESADMLCNYLNLSNKFPMYNGTEVTYFPLGEDKFEAMIEELEKAKEFIFLEYFIIDEGYMWGRILKILADKAAEGVEVRVMYDGMCEISTLTSDYPERLEQLGIKCKAFSRLTPFISTQYNYRDHRKILVIDGKVAFTGGVNLADEYINKIVRFGHWKDTAIMLKGKAVESFTLMFLQMWYISEIGVKPVWDKYLGKAEPAANDGYIIPYCDNPLDGYKVGETVYMDIIDRAKSYVHIMTPYLILDNELERSLTYAAQRGVDVKLILPGIPDKKAPYALAKSHYKHLIEAGIKIYEYDPGFVHAKVFVCDDKKAVVGTINLDYRSLYHHFECATYMLGSKCISDIEADFQSTLEKCSTVTEETIKNEKLYYKVMGTIMKVVAPLM